MLVLTCPVLLVDNISLIMYDKVDETPGSIVILGWDICSQPQLVTSAIN